MSVRTKRRPISRRAKRNGSGARFTSKISWRESMKDLIEKHSEGGVVLRGNRLKAELTQKELAEVIGISQHHISEMESGKRHIGKAMAKKFAVFFKTNYRVFL